MTSYTLAVCIALLLSLSASATEDVTAETLREYAHALVAGSKSERRRALRYASFNRDTQLIAAMILSLRYAPEDQREDIASALERMTNKNYGNDWFRWMQWQQANPDIQPFPSYDRFLASVLSSIDKDFASFIYPGIQRTIAIHEVVWGGVAAKVGIPALDHPPMVGANRNVDIGDNELVFGVAINDDVRAYPYRYMDWHEMLNDTIGGEPVSLAYCTLCGSGILYRTKIDTKEGIPIILKFGSSGLLHRSNKLMFDDKTNSLWNQFSGKPVAGTLATSNLQLSNLPLTTTTWKKWRNQHPQTLVMAKATGFSRDYTPGAAYGSYQRSPSLMFPASTDDRRFGDKSRVFGLAISGVQKVWPLRAFGKNSVINDRVGALRVVLIGDVKSQEVRAFRSDQITFTESRDGQVLDQEGTAWRITEEALVHPESNRQLSRLPGRLSYWFAWSNTYSQVEVAE